MPLCEFCERLNLVDCNNFYVPKDRLGLSFLYSTVAVIYTVVINELLFSAVAKSVPKLNIGLHLNKNRDSTNVRNLISFVSVKAHISITPLKQLCCISMIISSMPLDHRSFHVFCLSAAFDTTDHNILITHLSPWFGIQLCSVPGLSPILSVS